MDCLTLDILQKSIIQLSLNTTSILLDLVDNEQALINKLIYSGLFENEQYLNESIKYTRMLKPGNKYNSTACIETNNKVMLIKYIPFKFIKSILKSDLLDGYNTMYNVISDKDIFMTLISKNGNHIYIWKIQFSKTNIINIIDHSTYCFI